MPPCPAPLYFYSHRLSHAWAVPRCALSLLAPSSLGDILGVGYDHPGRKGSFESQAGELPQPAPPSLIPRSQPAPSTLPPPPTLETEHPRAEVVTQGARLPPPKPLALGNSLPPPPQCARCAAHTHAHMDMPGCAGTQATPGNDLLLKALRLSRDPEVGTEIREQSGHSQVWAARRWGLGSLAGTGDTQKPYFR